ncbi:MAG: hypothetical protein AAGE52_00725 [Myxococcota bacterium]
MSSPFRQPASAPNANTEANDAIDEAIAASKARRRRSRRRALVGKVIAAVLVCTALVGFGFTSGGTAWAGVVAVAILGVLFVLVFHGRDDPGRSVDPVAGWAQSAYDAPPRPEEPVRSRNARRAVLVCLAGCANTGWFLAAGTINERSIEEAPLHDVLLGAGFSFVFGVFFAAVFGGLALALLKRVKR